MTKASNMPVPGTGGSFMRQKDGTLVPNTSDPETAARNPAPAGNAPEAQKPGSKSKLKEA